jgi:hypothetical protein
MEIVVNASENNYEVVVSPTKDEYTIEVIDNTPQYEVVVGSGNGGGGDVILERTDNTLIETIAAPATRELDDLIIEVVDEDDNPILTLNQLVYTEQTLDLSILAECNNLINLNNLIVSNTQPVGQPNGHYWFQPL